MATKSESFFNRTLNAKTQEARTAVIQCVNTFISTDAKKRQPSAAAAYNAVGRVIDMLHESDRPDWLMKLHGQLHIANVRHHENNSVDAVRQIAARYLPILETHKWNVDEGLDVQGFDFDAVYEKYRNESKLQELFDEMIRYLREIVELESIDSVKAIRELHEVIATLSRARDGSYFASRSAWFFLITWLRNTGWEILSDIPGAGAIVRGFRTTISETDFEMAEMHDKIQKNFEKSISSDFPKLEYKNPEIPSLTSDRDKNENHSSDK